MKLKEPEAQFRVSFTVGERRLGTTLALIDGAPNLSVDLLKEQEASRNLPKGAFLEAATAAIKAARGKLSGTKLRDLLVSKGFPRKSVYNQLVRYVAAGKLIKKGTNGSAVYSLPKKGG